jgi:murein DD-endopeptidase MepM/ murein hydrolase activator NlpD
MSCLQSGRFHLVSFSRTQLIGVCSLLLATGVAVYEHQSHLPVLTGNTRDLIVAQKDTKAIPSNLTELADQITNLTESIPEITQKENVLQISSGDTMMSLLVKIGVNREEATQAIQALKRVYDPRELKVGQDINVRYCQDSSKDNVSLLGLSFKASHENEITLEAGNGAFTAKKYQIALKKVQKRVEGTIGSSFYSAALKRGVPAHVVREAINALSYDINWQHDPTRGDPFTIVYDVYQDTNGQVVRADNLKYVSFAPSGKKAGGRNNVRQVYRFQPIKGAPGYYDANGMNVAKTLLQTPLDPSKMRVTSKFGRRIHPCLGYSQHHKGVDFSAPAETPVRAAGAGTIVKASYWGNYGNYIMIKHNDKYSTAYAHLSRMKVRVGMKVRQNQIIGNVGATGRTTGPHLHYEVLCNNVHVNPQSIKQLPMTKLTAKDLADFRRVKAQIEREATEVSTSQVASAGTQTQTS